MLDGISPVTHLPVGKELESFASTGMCARISLRNVARPALRKPSRLLSSISGQE
jgi:hypothetical protein